MDNNKMNPIHDSPMICGHPLRFAWWDDEGTSLCVMCEYKAAVERIRTLNARLYALGQTPHKPALQDLESEGQTGGI